MTLIGSVVTPFTTLCVDSPHSPERTVRSSDFHGRWLLLMFYPRDFSFVCPTELTSLSDRAQDFGDRHCAILAMSVDSVESHRRWLNTSPADGGLGPINFPLATDPDGTIAKQFGVWMESRKLPARGTFLIDPEGVLQFAVLHGLSVGRNVEEMLRVLSAIQSGGLCPAGWSDAQGIIDAENLLNPGRVVGHYRIVSTLGRGAFGRVFSAFDVRLERPVALKVLSRNSADSRTRLLAEARASAKLNHSNICMIHAVDEEDGLPLIVMELIQGETLAEAIRRGLTQEERRTVLQGVADGMEAAHALGIIHGDLKPANVMINSDGIPKILDFGLARSKRRLAAAEVTLSKAGFDRQPDKYFLATESGTLDETVDYGSIDPNWSAHENQGISGTPAYLSPEQALGQHSSFASDVFTFGLLCYEVLTGCQALGENSLAKILARLKSAELSEQLASRIEPKIQPLIRSMLSQDPTSRPTMATIACLLTLDDLWSGE